MTEAQWEIPPLDGAADIARGRGPQTGATLADTRNWAGFALLGAGGLAALIAAVVSLAGSSEAALFLVVVAVVSVFTGAALVLERRRRERQRARGAAQEQRWRETVPPRA